VGLDAQTLVGNATVTRSLARLVGPVHDIAAIVATTKRSDIPKSTELKGSRSLKVDPVRVLASLERRSRALARTRDEQIEAVTHGGGPVHTHVEILGVPGVYHLGFYVEGTYCPQHDVVAYGHEHHGHEHRSAPHGGSQHVGACGPDCSTERFTRILSASVPVLGDPVRRKVATRRPATAKARARRTSKAKTPKRSASTRKPRGKTRRRRR
jgi:hypothetical protein